MTCAAHARALGGKGANQARAAKLTSDDLDVTFVARIHERDVDIIDDLESCGVNCDDVELREDTPTGAACVVTDANGENCIVVYPGANAECDGDKFLANVSDDFEPACALFQCETPIETSKVIARWARTRNANCVSFMNFSPANAKDGGVCTEFDVLVVNETEVRAVVEWMMTERDDAYDASVAAIQTDLDDPVDCAMRVAKCGSNVLLTLGAEGAAMFLPRRPFGCESAPVNDGTWVERWIDVVNVGALAFGESESVVDSVGAGDAFVGAFVAAVAENRTLFDALRVASAAGGLACTERGARTRAIENALERASDVELTANFGPNAPSEALLRAPAREWLCRAREMSARDFGS